MSTILQDVHIFWVYLFLTDSSFILRLLGTFILLYHFIRFILKLKATTFNKQQSYKVISSL